MLKALFLLLSALSIACASRAQNDDADLQRRWKAGMDAAGEQRISNLKAKPFINGHQYTDSAYGVSLRFGPGDSVADKSSEGMALFLVTADKYFVRISSVHFASVTGLEKYAREQQEAAKDHAPAGAQHYKVSKLKERHGEYAYSYRVTWEDKDGFKLITVVHIGGTDRRYSAMKVAGLFPDDDKAAEKEEKVYKLARSVETFSE